MLQNEFNLIGEKFAILQGELLKASFKANEEVFDAALYLMEAVGAFIEAVEHEDENMDPETTKLPNIDNLFDEPVNDYVQASIQYAVDGTPEAEQKLFEAAMNLKAYQDGYEPEEFDEEDCCDCPEGCCLIAEVPLLDLIKEEDCEHAANVNAFCDLIEKGLDGATEFDAEDLELIRYYLKTLPDNSDYDIDMLSDRALVLAWKKHEYLRNNK